MSAPSAGLSFEEAAPGRPGHWLQPKRRSHRRVGWLGMGPAIALAIHVVAAFTLMPVAGHPYDLASLTGTSGAWLRWGVPLFYNWKFGSDLTVLAVGSQSLAYVLQHIGMSGAAALSTAWKLPLVLADSLVGVILVDLGKQLRSPRAGLIATLWLISPVPLWVSAGHGQIESLTILAIVLSLDLLIRRRPFLAGVAVGLGIGIEYLPVLVGLIVIFWFFRSAIGRRELLRFALGGVGTLALCFGPPLTTVLGRKSLLGGLSFTARVASHPGNAQASSVNSSLWAMFDLSPGAIWLVIAVTGAALLMIVATHRSRNAEYIDRIRLGVAATGGLLLCITLFDPGALPQFSVLVLAGLCLVGLCFDLSPLVIIFGPALQLAAGFFYVYGGNFQSFWYDMWVTTGVGGWPFPQSFHVQGWAARLGAVVVTLGLISVLFRPSAETLGRAHTIVVRAAVVTGALATVFLAIWSLQPAFWQAVGPHGPTNLADFPLITATQPGKLTSSGANSAVTFSSSQVLAAQGSSVQPSLKLKISAQPFFARTSANTAAFNQKAVQKVTIFDWKHQKSEVNSLWISALFGRPSWSSSTQALDELPVLVAGGRSISSSLATLVAPGWAVVTYEVPAARVSPSGQLKLGLQRNSVDSVKVAWNGSPHVRWVVVSLRSGMATATVNGKYWHGAVTLPSPDPTLWIQHTEEASFTIPLRPQNSISIADVKIGGQQADLGGASFSWPSSSALDYTIHAPLLIILGILDLIALVGGGLVVGRWAVRHFPPYVRTAHGRVIG